ncbi:disease resistance protein RPP5-like [Cornus florida]|uniref:disease resistance protein RPP5-like n=1 Tax=Cornus florida TaxID=4283 RepID=UPI0028967A55|nr:disease resistance protein RPP5-like [Cornus florida]XP_059639941.1 disease resistance protein RPP5-like [Cornus florida]XP_059639942.1 disease resistance protein RPP5-like [Cornus florida]
MEKVVRQLPRLRVLNLHKCPKSNRILVLSLPCVSKLFVEECDEIVLKSVIDLTSLTSLKIKRVRGLCILSEEVVQFLVALEIVEFKKCDQLLTPWENGLTLGKEDTLLLLPFCKLKSLKIRECANLEKLPNGLNNLKSLKRLDVIGCSKLVRFLENGLPPFLSWLKLEDCKGLRWCPTDTFPTTLKYIYIINSMELEWVSETMVHDEKSSSSRNGMSSLETISMINWPNMGRLVGCVKHFANLLRLYIWNCDSLECFPERGGLSSIPLTTLRICKCVNLRSLPPFDQIQSLAYLYLDGCPNLELFGNGKRNGNLPPQLVTITVDGDYGKPSLSEWGLHKHSASIVDFRRWFAFLMKRCVCFLQSLTELFIWNLSNVECISSKGFRNPTSLQHLDFYHCSKLPSLPMDVLASTLQSLKIENCPNLKEGCKKEREDYWPMIADIPCVEIDVPFNIDEFIS